MADVFFRHDQSLRFGCLWKLDNRKLFRGAFWVKKIIFTPKRNLTYEQSGFGQPFYPAFYRVYYRGYSYCPNRHSRR